MTTTVTAKIQIRRGTAAAWVSANPILIAAEIGYETDTGKQKMGDGTTAWNSLPYYYDPNQVHVTDHGALTGLSDDDHAQYHTDARGDARYSLLGHNHSGVYALAANGVTNGDSHDHSGGDGAQIAYSGLSGLPTLGTAAAQNTTAFEAAGAVSTHAALTTAHGISSFGASLVDDADATAARTTLGLGTAATTAATDYATASHNHAASAITSGTIDAARLGSGTASASTYLRGDQTWAAAAGGVASDTHAAATKATPVDADELPIVDSAASFVLKNLTWANLKTTLSGVFPLLEGKSGGQTLIGGSGVTDKLVLQGTSGNGTVTSTALECKVGNNGALTALTIANSGQLTIKGDATTDLPTYGSELLSSAGWTVNTGWTESPDDVFAHSSGTGTLTHSATITNSYKYQISWTITGRTTGSITISVGGQSNTAVSATGTWGPTATDASAFTITPTTDFNGTVSLTSLKRITAVSTSNSVVKNSSGAAILEMRGNGTSVFIGPTSGQYNTTGSNNGFFGYQAGYANTTGSDNTFVGFQAGFSNTTGISNCFFGSQAGRNNTTGSYNSCIGYLAGSGITSGNYNYCIGYLSGMGITTGIYNTCIGAQAGRYNTTGNSNCFIGVTAGRYHADGSTVLTDPENSIYIGKNARGKDNADDNSVVIGGNTPIGLGANTTVIGTSATTLTRLFGNLGLGVDSPSASIHTIKTTEQLRLGYDASNYASATVASDGTLSLTTSNNKIVLGASRTPASASAAGVAGEVCWDASYIYVCTATNTWKRAAISTW